MADLAHGFAIGFALGWCGARWWRYMNAPQPPAPVLTPPPMYGNVKRQVQGCQPKAGPAPVPPPRK